MAEKMPCCFVIFGDGFLRSDVFGAGKTSLDSNDWTGLHNLAKAGVSGFLALRKLPEQVEAADRLFLELAQVLDVYDALQLDAKPASNGLKDMTVSIPSLSERFMNLSAGMMSNSDVALSLGQHAGFSHLPLMQHSNKEDSMRKPGADASDVSAVSESDSVSLPDPTELVERVVRLLGLSEGCDDGNDSGNERFDMIFLHLHADDIDNSDISITQCVAGSAGALKGLAWVDAVAREIERLKYQQGSQGQVISSQLYFVVLMGYGNEPLEHVTAIARDNDVDVLKPPSISAIGGVKVPEKMRKLIPTQSYEMKNGIKLNNVRHKHPILAVHFLKGVTRSDHAERMSVSECHEKGANRAILADRFLPEIAFKISRAPKYGA